MTMEELFAAVNIFVAGDGEHVKVDFKGIPEKKRGVYIDFIKANKPQIIERIKSNEAEAKRTAEEREAKIAAIPGLKEIEEARADMERWHYEFNRSFDGEYAVGGMGVRPKPNYDFDAMYAKYPVAAAYLKALKQSRKSNYGLATIGEKALEAIINDTDNYAAIIAEMDAEISAYAERHLWG